MRELGRVGASNTQARTALKTQRNSCPSRNGLLLGTRDKATGSQPVSGSEHDEASMVGMPQDLVIRAVFAERGTRLELATACLEGILRCALWHGSRFSRGHAGFSLSSLSEPCPVMVS